MRYIAPALCIIAVIGIVTVVRRWAPRGLGTWLAVPGDIVATGMDEFSSTVRSGADALSIRAKGHYGEVARGARHPLAHAVTISVFALVWIAGTVLYLNRNAAIVLAAHDEAVRVGARSPVTGERVVAFAQVFAPVLLTAAVGIVLFEMIGVSDHLPFLHGLRIGRLLPVLVAALGVLAVAGLMQYSVARQEMAQARTEMLATVQTEFTNTVPPLPTNPTAAEVTGYNRAITDFDSNVRQPALDEFASSVGPLGWKTLLPVGAALLDFVFAWATIPFLLLLWVVALEALRGIALLLALIAAVCGGSARALTVGMQSMFNVRQPSRATLGVATVQPAAQAMPGAMSPGPIPSPPAPALNGAVRPSTGRHHSPTTRPPKRPASAPVSPSTTPPTFPPPPPPVRAPRLFSVSPTNAGAAAPSTVNRARAAVANRWNPLNGRGPIHRGD